MYLIAALLSLLAGPLLYRLMAASRRLLIVLDGFIFIVIGGLVLLEVLPDAMHTGGAWVLLFALIGFIGPTLVESAFHRVARQMHIATLIFAFVGLLLHTLADGVALDTGSNNLSLAVILHRIPVALAVWWLLRPAFGTAAACGGLVLMAAGTIGGWWIGHNSAIELNGVGLAWFQGLVAGSVLHVVFNRPHIDQHSTETEVQRRGLGWIEGGGNLLGLLVLVALFAAPELHLGHAGSGLDGEEAGEVAHAHHHVSGEEAGSVGQVFLSLALQSAPALLLAYLIGGLLSEFMPASSINWLKRGRHSIQALRGVVMGLPLPVCSCGVVPLYRSLIQRGAPPTAAMAFLIATPELGIDALLLSFPLLGIEMTMARLIAAFVVALLVGWAVGRLTSTAADSGPSSCCGGSADETADEQGFGKRFSTAMREGFGELVDTTAPWILVGLVIAALAQPLLEASGIAALPGYWQVLLFAIIGTPLYVCATGATPIAAALLISGVSPGAAIAFLLTGPATNITTFGVLSGLHGRATALRFGLTTAALAIAAGLVTNMLLPDFQPVIATDPEHLHDVPWWQQAALVGLGLAYLLSMLRRGARAFFGELFTQAEPHAH